MAISNWTQHHILGQNLTTEQAMRAKGYKLVKRNGKLVWVKDDKKAKPCKETTPSPQCKQGTGVIL